MKIAFYKRLARTVMMFVFPVLLWSKGFRKTFDESETLLVRKTRIISGEVVLDTDVMKVITKAAKQCTCNYYLKIIRVQPVKK